MDIGFPFEVVDIATLVNNAQDQSLYWAIVLILLQTGLNASKFESANCGTFHKIG